MLASLVQEFAAVCISFQTVQQVLTSTHTHGDLIRVVLRQRLGPEVDDHWVQVLPEQDGWGARMLAIVLGSLTYCGILIRTGEDPSKIGSGGHWISLRRLAGDGWFDLNSLNASARLIVSADASPEVQAEKLCAALQGYQDNSPHFNVYAITSLKVPPPP